MDGDNKVTVKRKLPSIKHKSSITESGFYRLGDFVRGKYTPSDSIKKQDSKNSELKSDKMLTTAELISAIDQIWNCANGLSVSRPKAKALKEDIFDHMDGVENVKALNSADCKSFGFGLSQKSPSLQPKVEYLNITQKMAITEPYGGNYNQTFLRRILHGSTNLSNERVGICFELSMYHWMKGMLPSQVKGAQIQKTGECFAEIRSSNARDSISSLACGSASAKSKDTSINSDLIVTSSTHKEAEPPIEDIGTENNVKESLNRLGIPSSAVGESKLAMSKTRHAFAGALAGICVSLCLHPLDTVKTVLQSCQAEQKSIYDIGRSIISERGYTGLYRGITSNIASSAPISAVYTFTYESVKGALLPLFPKEYCSLGHCVAGGSASVATSFIFTPSEHIKQQMQVGLLYPNCWKALSEVIRKGGLPSLYAGWGAVLCRNVPHSIIKFYAYESLKQMMLSSQSKDQLNILQTLVCGGLAGSTAAFFTTPFDVVKTRLQTQIPGSSSRYGNVFQTLQEIGKREGVGGLYRGLIPRLVMYMSQGALFFASYEFFKGLLFCQEAPNLAAPAIGLKKSDQEYSQSPLSAA